MDPSRAPLPIDEHLDQVCAAMRSRRNVVVVAPPGAGKTTRVPIALLEAGMTASGEIVVLEPRRIAARMSAERVAGELGEEVGRRIGYATRFERRVSDATLVRFVTEGLLSRQLLSNPTLEGVAVVLLDEFHERHLTSDLSLALLRRLQTTSRPELCIGVMSATIDPEPIARFLDAEIVASEGRSHPVRVDHLPRPDDRPLENQVQSAVLRLRDEGIDGDVLVFLPGARAIRRAHAACESLAARHGLLMRPLFGSQSAAEQDQAIAPADRPKIILSTNVAETSITIDGVVAVIDSGLAQVAHQPPWSTLPQLQQRPISKASAHQRAGRAGRTRPGRCLRLFTELDFARRAEHEQPEVARVDLAEALLELYGAGISEIGAIEWFEPPPAAARDAAEELLLRLGALGPRLAPRQLSEIGRRMLRYPLHPRLSRIMVECERRGIAREGAVVAALLSERGLSASRRSSGDAGGTSDLLALLGDFEAATGPGAAREIQARAIDRGRLSAAKRATDQLRRISRTPEARRGSGAPGGPELERDLGIAILTGFADRVGRLRRPERSTGRSAREIVFASGGTAALAEESVVTNADLVVAALAEERRDGRDRRPLVRMASAVDPDWLLELYTDDITETREVQVSRSGRAERVERLVFGALTLEEKTCPAEPGPATQKALALAARARGLDAFFDRDALDRLRARVAFIRSIESLPAQVDLADADLWRIIEEACAPLTSLADLPSRQLSDLVAASPSGRASWSALSELAPERVTLPQGRQVRVVYAEGSAPHVESRLQDFFGMTEGPRIAGGRIPLVLHLLAPNGRAVQVTTDLSRFWEQHYPAIAKELRRRYPRHAWPDDPRTAKPPSPGRRRPNQVPPKS